MTVFPRRKSRTYAIFKPGIVEAVTYLHTTSTVRHRNIITTAEFVQQISFSVEDAFAADFFADIEANTANSTFNATLVYFNTITGNVIVASQIPQCKLRLRFNVPAIL